MTISKKHRNKLSNLVKSNKPLTSAQRQFLYDKGQNNFDAVRNMLFESEPCKMNHKCSAIRILYMLRVFDRHEDFIKIVTELISDESIGVRSCCFNLLVVLAAESLRKMTNEFDKPFIEKKIIPVINMAVKQGVSTDSVELAERLLNINMDDFHSLISYADSKGQTDAIKSARSNLIPSFHHLMAGVMAQAELK